MLVVKRVPRGAFCLFLWQMQMNQATIGRTIWRANMSDLNEAIKRFEAYRFFTIKNEKMQGDRFLEPWILLLTMSRTSLSNRNLRRLDKQLQQVFAIKPIAEARALAGDQEGELLYGQLYETASRYLQIAKEDPGYNSGLFGFVKLKEADRERKLAGDVHKHMLAALLAMDDFPYRSLMLRAMHAAFIDSEPAAQDWFAGWRESLQPDLQIKLDRLLHV